MKMNITNYSCCGIYETPGVCPICGQRRTQQIDRTTIEQISQKTAVDPAIVRSSGVELGAELEQRVIESATQLYLTLHTELIAEIQNAVPLEIAAELQTKIEQLKNQIETQNRTKPKQKLPAGEIDEQKLGEILKSAVRNYKLVELEYRNTHSAELADKLLEIDSVIRAVNNLNNFLAIKKSQQQKNKSEGKT